MFGSDFQHDVILIQAFVNVGDLALAEGIAESVVNVLNGDAETAGGVTVDDDGTLQAMHLLVGVDVAQLGDFLQALHDDGGPVNEVGEIVGLKGVLELSAAEAAADVEILDSLQVHGGAGNFGSLRTNAGDELIHGDLALPQRLELAEHAGGAAAVAAAGKGCDGVDRGVLQDDVGELTHLLGHGREGKILIALDQPTEAAGILLRKEALGSLDEEIEVQTNGAESDEQDKKLMAENPAQGDIVSVQQTIESVLGKSIETIVPAGFVAKEASAHHGRGSERNQKRDANGHAENYGELAKKPAHDAAHQKNRNKDSHERGAHRKDSESDFTGAFHGGFVGLHAAFYVASNVFDDDDGIVDDEAGRNRKGHEREVVQAGVAEIHHAKCADEGERNGDAGNDGGPGVAQECEDHENHEDDGNREGDFHVVDGSANGGGAVDNDNQMQRGRDGCAELRKHGVNAIYGLNHVGGGLAKDGDEDSIFADGEA